MRWPPRECCSPRPNAGFALATPVGLRVASVFAAASSLDLARAAGAAVMRRGPWLIQWASSRSMAAWAAVSLPRLGPLDDATRRRARLGPLGGAGGRLAVVLYLVGGRALPAGAAARGVAPAAALAAAFTLLAEAMIAVALGRNWHVSWWEWHLLMLAAFVLIAVSAQRSWREERWAGLYLPDTAVGASGRSRVLFADLEGFTTFSERHDPQQVTAMLNTYFTAAIPPVVKRFGGQIDRLVGDAIMVAFNPAGDQPDHARRAAGAALAIQEATGAVAAAHPDWPRFRVGVNSGRRGRRHARDRRRAHLHRHRRRGERRRRASRGKRPWAASRWARRRARRSATAR